VLLKVHQGERFRNTLRKRRARGEEVGGGRIWKDLWGEKKEEGRSRTQGGKPEAVNWEKKCQNGTGKNRRFKAVENLAHVRAQKVKTVPAAYCAMLVRG